MASELTPLLLRTALFTSLAILMLLALRAPLRRWLGAQLAYQAWLIVPVVALAANLPKSSSAILITAPALAPVRELATLAAPVAPSQVDMLSWIWVCGAAAAACWCSLAHRAFLRKAGRLTRSGDVYISGADAGPASVGLFHPRIVLPHDFAQRYSLAEQALVIAHERTHIVRRDALANLVAALFQCVFWFNPLVHIGARCFRQDQELACDAIVMQQHPRQRRAYAEALLKCHTGGHTAHAGINCHWQAHHPTKERLMNLQHTPPGTTRRIAGRCMLALLAIGAFGSTLNVRAGQADAAPSYAIALAVDAGTRQSAAVSYYAVAMTMDAGGEQSAPRILAKAGEKFAVASGGWRIDMTARPGPKPGEVWLAGTLAKGGDIIGTPTLLARFNEKATIKVGEGDAPFTLSMTVSPQH